MKKYDIEIQTLGLFQVEFMSRADWDFWFVSLKLYMVINNDSDSYIHKYLLDAGDNNGSKCGFKALILLNRTCEPVTPQLPTTPCGQE